jgi:hypothetical protein
MEEFMNLAINGGDILNSIPIWKIETTRQYLKQILNGKTLRMHLLDKGIAHSFYKGFLWIIPINGKETDELDLKGISENFLKWGKEQICEFNNNEFFSEEFWYPLGIVILRDAISYALRAKLKDERNLIINVRNVYDKKQIIYERGYSYVILGLSLNKILRIKHLNLNNVCICPEIVYECYNLTSIVRDRFERQRNILVASRCNSREYYRRLSLMIGKVFPLDVKLANKTLKFNSAFYTIPMKEDRIRQEGLRKWF